MNFDCKKKLYWFGGSVHHGVQCREVHRSWTAHFRGLYSTVHNNAHSAQYTVHNNAHVVHHPSSLCFHQEGFFTKGSFNKYPYKKVWNFLCTFFHFMTLKTFSNFFLLQTYYIAWDCVLVNTVELKITPPPPKKKAHTSIYTISFINPI